MSATTRYQFPPVTVPAQSSAQVSLGDDVVPEFFQPTWLEIPDEVAEHLLITGLYTDRQEQLLSRGAVPASLFAKSCPIEDKYLSIAVCDPRTRLSVSVTNMSNKAQLFECELIGYLENDVPRTPRPSQYVIGLSVTSVARKSGANISVQPNMAIRPQVLYVPPSVVECFTVSGVFCDRGRSSSVNQDSLDSELLTRGSKIALSPDPVVTVSQFLTVSVINRGERAACFTGAYLATDPPVRAIL